MAADEPQVTDLGIVLNHDEMIRPVHTADENVSATLTVAAPGAFRTPAAFPVVFVEVQHGDYFGEDDIVRLDDDYGRLPLERPSRT